MEVLTIEDILNSDLMNQLISEEDKALSEAGWTYKEVQSFAKGMSKNIK